MPDAGERRARDGVSNVETLRVELGGVVGMLENLGKYGEITKQAAEAGGVDKLISAIEKAAYAKGAATGVLVGGAAVSGVTAVVMAYRSRKARGEEAKEHLRAAAREAEGRDS
ncbi:hypothetical protein [Streptomyces sp. NPDC088935]|uniref:hypothetical protein n=2 Tax=Streptomyces TaxID=1883 RepID=UPI00382E7386